MEESKLWNESTWAEISKTTSNPTKKEKPAVTKSSIWDVLKLRAELMSNFFAFEAE